MLKLLIEMSKNYSLPSSPSDSLKKQNSKACDEESTTSTAKTDNNTAIHENFVLLSAPDKFKDKPEGATSVPEPQMTNHNCFLLADTARECVPQHLENILQHIDRSQLSQAELLFLLIYTVALESGFTNAQEYIKNVDHLYPVSSSSSFHFKNVLHLSRQKPTYSSNEDRTCFTLKLHSIVDLEETSDTQTMALLTAFNSGDLMIVTLSPANSTGAKGFSTAISVGRYVLSVQGKNNPIHHRFCKLDELTLQLRDKLYVPMRNQHMLWLYAGIYPSLESMPQELYDYIFNYLKIKEIKIVANVSKSLYGAAMNNKRLLNTKRT